ncbi:unnamed protein product [Sphagnum jensenii]|uniref:Uncharacterized protein n=1 Tax=Sphagnum jensenii TaxID=128206 RepID=A0ABP0WDR6_9BRYO
MHDLGLLRTHHQGLPINCGILVDKKERKKAPCRQGKDPTQRAPEEATTTTDTTTDNNNTTRGRGTTSNTAPKTASSSSLSLSHNPLRRSSRKPAAVAAAGEADGSSSPGFFFVGGPLFRLIMAEFLLSLNSDNNYYPKFILQYRELTRSSSSSSQ